MPDAGEPSAGAARPANGSLRAVLHYGVGELYVKREQLGREWGFERGGHQVNLALPTSEGAFRRASNWPLQALAGSRMGEEGPHQQFGLSTVQVAVELGRGLGDEGSGNAEMALMREADDVAASVVRSLLDWARTDGAQIWLPPGHERPGPVGEAWLEDGSANRLWTYPFRRPIPIVMLDLEWSARIGELESMGEEVLRGEVEPPVAESLLADARHAVWPARDSDTQRAVLLAAIALETKTPDTLRRIAREEQSDLLELLLKSHDEVPTSVPFQLDKLAKRLCGRSLKQDDGELLKEVRALYGLRNDVAHRGAKPVAVDARNGVQATVETFDWLNGLTPAPEPSETVTDS